MAGWVFHLWNSLYLQEKDEDEEEEEEEVENKEMQVIPS